MNVQAKIATADPASIARKMLVDPADCFNRSYAAMHGMDRSTLEAVQLAGLKLRFAALRNAIPTLKKLADEAGVHEIRALEDVIPILFKHTVYKSYPISLLEKNRFPQLTHWLQKLTTVDLTGLDASGCQGIDDWIALLERETSIRVIQSSGTTGTVSFLPRTAHEIEKHFLSFQIGLFELAGLTPPARDQPLNMEVVHASYRRGTSVHLRLPDSLLKWVCNGDEAKLHALYPGAQSADLMFLAGRIAAAEAKGEFDRIQLSPSLLARRGEFEAMQRAAPDNLERFYDGIITRLQGKQIYITATSNVLYKVAAAGLEKGMEAVFASNSLVNTGGGFKGEATPPDWQNVVKRFFGVKHINRSYGMSEIMANNKMCAHERYHIEPWAILFVLDPDTGEQLPRSGVQTGRAALYDLQSETYWGGFVSGDEVSVDWDTCACGRNTPHIGANIGRYSELRGGNDKISCAASPEAHESALNFLTDIGF